MKGSEYGVLPSAPGRKRGSVLQGKLGYNTASSPQSDVGCGAHHLRDISRFFWKQAVLPCRPACLPFRRGITLAGSRSWAPGAQRSSQHMGVMLSSDRKPSAHGARGSFYGTNNRSEAKLPHFFEGLKNGSSNGAVSNQTMPRHKKERDQEGPGREIKTSKIQTTLLPHITWIISSIRCDTIRK